MEYNQFLLEYGYGQTVLVTQPKQFLGFERGTQQWKGRIESINVDTGMVKVKRIDPNFVNRGQIVEVHYTQIT